MKRSPRIPRCQRPVDALDALAVGIGQRKVNWIQGALSSVRFGDVHPPCRLRPVGTLRDTVVQVQELALQPLAVCFPGYPVHTCRSLFAKPAIGRPQKFDIDMMHQGGEPLTPSVPSMLACTRSSPWDMFSRLGVRHMPCSIARFPWLPALCSIGSADSCSSLFADFPAVGSEEAPTEGLASVRRSNWTCSSPRIQLS